jgi:calcineurin-like phosphoesterase family protein
MSYYCVGDLHGNYELFNECFDKINFDYDKDTLFFLGDVIDRQQGGVKLLQLLMNNRDHFKLISGNHERTFLVTYDKSIKDFLIDEGKKNLLVELIQTSIGEFTQFNGFEFCYKKTGEFEPTKKLLAWVEKSKKRQELYNLLSKVDITTYYNLRDILNNLTKNFILELLELDNSEIYAIVDYLQFETVREIDFDYNGKHFVLTHYFVDTLSQPYKLFEFESEQTGSYYIFGHTPVALLHKKLSHWVDFNYKEIFSYIGINNNYFFNLDLTPNSVCILRLDDFYEFYTTKKGKSNSDYTIASDGYNRLQHLKFTPNMRKFFFYNEKDNPDEMYEKNEIYRSSKDVDAYITVSHKCYDRVIIIDKQNKVIFYTEFHEFYQLKQLDYYSTSIEELVEYCNKTLPLERTNNSIINLTRFFNILKRGF